MRGPWVQLLAAIEQELGRPIEYHVTTDWDILAALQHNPRDVAAAIVQVVIAAVVWPPSSPGFVGWQDAIFETTLSP